MGLFKRKKNAVIEVETCVVSEWLRNMWNVFTRALLLSPNKAIKRLLRLYEKAKKVKSV
jgi:hypothetical protein